MHIRRDSSPNRSLVVIKFRSVEEARDFAQEYNGRPFNAMEVSYMRIFLPRNNVHVLKPEICHVVNVLSVEIEANDATSLAMSRLATAQGSMHELPTCPVCLERMDVAITGLVTVPCSHTFHCMCLSKWGDSRCVQIRCVRDSRCEQVTQPGVLSVGTHRRCFLLIRPTRMHVVARSLILGHHCPSALTVRRPPACGFALYVATSGVDVMVARMHTHITS